MKASKEMSKNGILHTDGWAGRQQQPCEIIGETVKRYRIRAVEGQELRLPFRGRGVRKILRSGNVLVPKYAVTFPMNVG